jgi:hypothetical protein
VIPPERRPIWLFTYNLFISPFIPLTSCNHVLITIQFLFWTGQLSVKTSCDSLSGIQALYHTCHPSNSSSILTTIKRNQIVNTEPSIAENCAYSFGIAIACWRSHQVTGMSCLAGFPYFCDSSVTPSVLRSWSFFSLFDFFIIIFSLNRFDMNSELITEFESGLNLQKAQRKLLIRKYCVMQYNWHTVLFVFKCVLFLLVTPFSPLSFVLVFTPGLSSAYRNRMHAAILVSIWFLISGCHMATAL